RDKLVTGVQTCALPIYVLVTGVNGSFEIVKQGTLAALPSLQLDATVAAATSAVSTTSTKVVNLAVTAGSNETAYVLTDGTSLARSEERRVGKESRYRGR